MQLILDFVSEHIYVCTQRKKTENPRHTEKCEGCHRGKWTMSVIYTLTALYKTERAFHLFGIGSIESYIFNLCPRR